jgi:hypothetical protein
MKFEDGGQFEPLIRLQRLGRYGFKQAPEERRAQRERASNAPRVRLPSSSRVTVGMNGARLPNEFG